MSEKTATEQTNTVAHFLFAVIFLASLLLLLFFTDPNKSAFFVLAFFAVLFGFSLNALTAFLLGIVYRKQIPENPELRRVALRQALLLSFLITGLIFLSAQQLLFWWVGFIFAGAVLSLECFFLFN